MLIKTWMDWLLRPFNPQRSKLNRSFRNRANCSYQMLVPQNQQLWDLGIPEQSMDTQENEKAKLEVGPGYPRKSFKGIPFINRYWKTNSTLSFWPSSLMRALWFLQSTSVGIWSRLRFSLGQKTDGIEQVRYLKQNSRRKDAVSEMTLETREALEVNVNFATIFFGLGMVSCWLQTLQLLSSSFWARGLEVGKKPFASILQLWEGSPCKGCGEAATDEQATWTRVCPCQYGQIQTECGSEVRIKFYIQVAIHVDQDGSGYSGGLSYPSWQALVSTICC